MQVDEDVEEDNPAAGGSQRSSQRNTNIYFQENDEELMRFDEELRKYTSEAAHAEASDKTRLSETEAGKLLRDVIRFMIFRNETKPGVPVPRGELTKLFGQRRASAATIIKQAQERFMTVLGIEMRELKVPSAKAAAGSDDGSKHYVLRSCLPAVVRTMAMPNPDVHADPETPVPGNPRTPHQALTLTVLALIVMNGDRLTEDDLWRLLEDVGVSRNPTGRNAQHHTLGKVDEQIKLMLARRYLKASKGRGAEAGQVYEWGANALDEIGRDAVDDYIKETINHGGGVE